MREKGGGELKVGTLDDVKKWGQNPTKRWKKEPRWERSGEELVQARLN